MPEQHSGEQAEPNTLKNRDGEEQKWDPQDYPDGSPAREGHITKPSGQGGATPKARPDHQDMFPANYIPDDNVTESTGEALGVEKSESKTTSKDASK